MRSRDHQASGLAFHRPGAPSQATVSVSALDGPWSRRKPAIHASRPARARSRGATHRPILLTTLTTFGGLTPIILETSAQARQLIPMAISLGFGIVFATAITLIIVPCLYLLVDDGLAWWARTRDSGSPSSALTDHDPA